MHIPSMKDLDTQKIIAEGGNIALNRLMRNGLSANPEVHPSHSSSSLHFLFSFDPIDQPNLARRHRHAGTVTQAPSRRHHVAELSQRKKQDRHAVVDSHYRQISVSKPSRMIRRSWGSCLSLRPT